MAAYKIEYAGNTDRSRWDNYVRHHPLASVYHLYGWREVIQKAYGHAAYYLMLTSREARPNISPWRGENATQAGATVIGVLPLFHLNHVIFGNELVSLPFLDSGGILASCGEAEKILMSEAVSLGQKVGANRVEMRHERLLPCCGDVKAVEQEQSRVPLRLATRTDKVRMLLNLPGSPEMLMKSFKSKLRSQIMKPIREGLIAKSGRAELLNDFYKVFLVNMRDLGSPVHSLRLMQHVVEEFAERVRIFVVYKSTEPVAASLVIGFGKVLRNPWASSLRKFSSVSPNMLLYLRMLEFACDNGYRTFDFGRSTKGEGTYRFKEQWGAEPALLNWTYISLDGNLVGAESLGTERFEAARQCWRRLPLVVTKLIGPRIRKYISL